MKRFGATPEDIGAAAEKIDGDGFLRYKLSDIQKIFTRYEEAIEGKYRIPRTISRFMEIRYSTRR
ncbi:MAG: hypothetical protein V8Q42_11275 [Anaerovoracaceae bacterium]